MKLFNLTIITPAEKDVILHSLVDVGIVARRSNNVPGVSQPIAEAIGCIVGALGFTSKDIDHMTGHIVSDFVGEMVEKGKKRKEKKVSTARQNEEESK